MKINKKSWIVSLALLLLVTLSLAACQQGVVATGARSSNGAPDFTLNDLNGNPFRLSSTRGKVVILDFWATWCPPCRMEIPHFVSLYGKYRGKGLEIVGVSLDNGGVDAVRSFARNNNMNYPVVMGDQKVANDYGGIRSIPTTFVIDRKGQIVEKFIGYRGEDVFENAIKELL